MQARFDALNDAGFREDPYPVLAEMRERHPVHHLAPGLTESWHVFRYDDVRHVLLTPETFSSDRSLQGGGDLADANLAFLFNNMISATGERHRRLRMLGNRVFMARAIESFRPKVQAEVDARMDFALQAGGEIDLVEDFAAHITVGMICAVLGLPREDMEMIRRWTAVLGDNSGAVTWLAGMDPDLARRGRIAGTEMAAYFRDFLKNRRGEDDLLSAFQNVEVEGERLSEDELLSMAMLLLLAGNETTTNLITNFTRLLAAHSQEAAALRANPTQEAINGAVEETLRLRNSIRNVDRFALHDVEMHGVTIPKGGLVVVWLSAANRDPGAFDDPDRFDPARSPNRHLAFGQGAHMCLGSALARMETRIAAEAILTRTRSVELTGQAELGRNANFDNVTRQMARFHAA